MKTSLFVFLCSVVVPVFSVQTDRFSWGSMPENHMEGHPDQRCYMNSVSDKNLGRINEEQLLSNLLAHFRGARHPEDSQELDSVLCDGTLRRFFEKSLY